VFQGGHACVPPLDDKVRWVADRNWCAARRGRQCSRWIVGSERRCAKLKNRCASQAALSRLFRLRQIGHGQLAIPLSVETLAPATRESALAYWVARGVVPQAINLDGPSILMRLFAKFRSLRSSVVFDHRGSAT